MKFGIQFFPDVSPEQKKADQYWQECLHLTSLADEFGYTHIRTVEHHLGNYGGYSPNPHIFLAAAAMRTQAARLITGAVLPIFNNPLKIAGEIGMLDAISGGRLECGFARAFLPHEFDGFGRTLDESKARFSEGLEQVQKLLEEENVSFDGEFHSFKNITVTPRTTQQPRPPIWIAALITPTSFEFAGKMGFNIMAIPLTGGKMNELIGIYRNAWQEADHKGDGTVMLAHHMFCHEDRERAYELSRDPLNRYLESVVTSASPWLTGSSSVDYPGYDKIIEQLSEETFESQVEKGAAFVGTPDDINEQISAYIELTGGFEVASLQINFNDLPLEHAENSMKLFGKKVIPNFFNS
jgi:alkanesulfonate monooxygenase SsuD/methylene tetrahydromethanopterin reductase-like flavin-dependent oxidoreductase (luciferase family)